MKFLSTILAFFACLAVHAQQFLDNRTDLQKLELKGRVKSVKTFTLSKITHLTQEELQKMVVQGKKPPYYKREWGKTLYFNEIGYITKSRAKSALGNDIYDNVYDTEGKLIAITTFDDDESVRHVYSFAYDERGHIASAIRESSEKVYFKESYLCDNNGRLLHLVHDFLDGRIQEGRFEYKNGKLTKVDMTLNGEPVKTFICDGEFTNPTEIYSWRDGECTHIRFGFNDQKQPITVSTETATGEWYVSTERQLDNHGNVVSEKHLDEDGSIEAVITTTYKYDARGNWIRMETKGLDEYMDSIIEREIVYY